MKILFKDDKKFYYIENGILKVENQVYHNIRHNTNWNNIKHLKDAEVLYHYKDIKTGELYPVYYEHNGRFITEILDIYTSSDINDNYIRDYTISNLKLI